MLYAFAPGKGLVAVEPREDIQEATWVHLEAAGAEEKDRVAQLFSIPRAWLEPASGRSIYRPSFQGNGQRARLSLAAPFHDPEKDPREEVPYEVIPSGWIFTGTQLLTWSVDHASYLHQAAADPDLEEASLMEVLVHGLQSLARHYWELLVELNQEIRVLERSVLEAQRNPAVRAIMNLNKALLLFARSLDQNNYAMRRMRQWLEAQGLGTETLEDWDLAEDEMEETRDVFRQRNVTLASVTKVYTVMIQNNVNNVMKALTAVIIAAAVPTAV
ncbi:MAG: CorA family divalent cation transporter, partial [Bacillota bacterium]|nr:CorA family divalent cation transporter [Bacillota bacterium]